MERKVVVNKVIDGKSSKVAYITGEKIKDIYENLYYCDTLKVLVSIENALSNDKISYNLELVDYDDLALENFNKKLNNEEKIKKYPKLEKFIFQFANDLYFKVDHSGIKASLLSISNADSLKDKEKVIAHLDKLVTDWRLSMPLTLPKRK